MNMKKLIALVLTICTLLTLAACAPAVDPEAELAAEKQAYAEFRADLEDEAVVAVNAGVYLNADDEKMLCADVQNNSDADITNFVLSYAVWNKMGRPIVIRTQNNPNNTESVFESTETAIEVKANSTWEADAGLKLADNLEEIAYVEVIVVSYTKDGQKVTNPLYSAWKETYIDRYLSDWQMELMGVDGLDSDNTDNTQATSVSKEQALATLKDNLSKEKVVAVNEAVHKEMEDDSVMLSADLKNNADKQVKELVVAFAAWDIDGNPIKLKSASGTSEDAFVKRIGMGEVTVAAGQTWLADDGEDVVGYKVSSEQSNIAYVKAVVISGELEDGGSWSNPYYNQWKTTYENVKLEDWMK